VNLQASDLQALWVSFRLALVTVVCLLLLGAPLAWWLSRGRGWLRIFVEALVALPLILPPSVLGFYLLILMGSRGPLGGWAQAWGMSTLAFSFPGLVVGSIVYSLPFVVQPLQNSFREVDTHLLEAAATLGAGPVDRFVSVVLPHSREGWIRAAALGFAHTVGEFGVVLMIGGNIPGQTRVASIALYNHVEAMDYGQAHHLALVLLVLSLVMLLVVHGLTRTTRGRR
jgi:molybdate transport system permease protein